MMCLRREQQKHQIWLASLHSHKHLSLPMFRVHKRTESVTLTALILPINLWESGLMEAMLFPSFQLTQTPTSGDFFLLWKQSWKRVKSPRSSKTPGRFHTGKGKGGFDFSVCWQSEDTRSRKLSQGQHEGGPEQNRRPSLGDVTALLIKRSDSDLQEEGRELLLCFYCCNWRQKWNPGATLSLPRG